MMLVIFVIVIASLLATFAARSISVQRDAVSGELLSSRTHSAARAGVQWSAYRALQQNNCSVGSMSFATGALRGIRVTTGCVMRQHANSLGTIRAFRFTALAQYGNYGSADYASHRAESLAVRQF